MTYCCRTFWLSGASGFHYKQGRPALALVMGKHLNCWVFGEGTQGLAYTSPPSSFFSTKALEITATHFREYGTRSCSVINWPKLLIEKNDLGIWLLQSLCGQCTLSCAVLRGGGCGQAQCFSRGWPNPSGASYSGRGSGADAEVWGGQPGAFALNYRAITVIFTLGIYKWKFFPREEYSHVTQQVGNRGCEGNWLY